MRVYHMTEQPYPQAWVPAPTSLRVTLPNELCDPDVASDLLNRYLDEWCLADEVGLDIMVNEHHSTATCLTTSCLLTLGILARITKRARLLALGVPIAHRTDPVRVAEEIATVDLISKGRLEVGFVKGVPTEVAPANSVPVRMMDRLWDAHDLIVKAMTKHDGPFNWESEYFQYRQVNVWPRPYQQPHPPVWVTSMSPGAVRPIAERGHVLGTFLSGMLAKRMFDGYRQVWAERHATPCNIDRFGYLGLCAVASSEAEAHRRAAEIAAYLKTFKQCGEAYEYPPGYMAPEVLAKKLRTRQVPEIMVNTRYGKTTDVRECTIQDLVDADMLFAGTPDQVFAQITRFSEDVGGIGHLMLMMQGGHLSSRDTSDSLRLFGTEVLPRLKEWSSSRFSMAA